MDLQGSGDVLSCRFDKFERSESGNESVPFRIASGGVSNFEIADRRSSETTSLGERFNYCSHRGVCQSFENARVSKVS